jgi:hypothetical protein
MRSIFSAVAFAVALSAGPQLAEASTQIFNISGNNSQGAFTATVDLTVIGGYATSGTGTISGAGFSAPETLTLITLATPGGDYGGTVGWRSNGGDDFFGFDDAVPVTQSGGLLFVADPTISGGQPVWGTGLDFGFWNNGAVGTGSDYQAGFYGFSNSGYRFYEQTASNITVSVPEPSAWGLNQLGFAGLGFAGYRRKIGAALVG